MEVNEEEAQLVLSLISSHVNEWCGVPEGAVELQNRIAKSFPELKEQIDENERDMKEYGII